jgi:hypothetical protein
LAKVTAFVTKSDSLTRWMEKKTVGTSVGYHIVGYWTAGKDVVTIDSRKNSFVGTMVGYYPDTTTF